MWPFKPKPLISADLQAWIVDNFDWVQTQRPNWWEMAQLIQPTRAFFAAPQGDTHETACLILKDVQNLLGLETEITLHPLPDLPDELSHQYGVLSVAGGEYWHDAKNPMITYNPKLLRNPMAFINMMAHELMHARLASVINDLPGGAAAHELATDLHCIIAGFGIFQLEAAEQEGWSGYMGQASRAVALAEFLARKGCAQDAALRHLSTRPRRWLSKALTEVQ